MMIITNAIRESIRTNSVPRLDEIDAKREGVTLDALCVELHRECEGDVVANGLHEFWGRNVDGEEWRVHVRLGDDA